jgi:hypothetical protein
MWPVRYLLFPPGLLLVFFCTLQVPASDGTSLPPPCDFQILRRPHPRSMRCVAATYFSVPLSSFFTLYSFSLVDSSFLSFRSIEISAQFMTVFSNILFLRKSVSKFCILSIEDVSLTAQLAAIANAAAAAMRPPSPRKGEIYPCVIYCTILHSFFTQRLRIC